MNKKFKKYNFCYTKQIKRIELSKKDYLIKVKYIKCLNLNITLTPKSLPWILLQFVNFFAVSLFVFSAGLNLGYGYPSSNFFYYFVFICFLSKV